MASAPPLPPSDPTYDQVVKLLLGHHGRILAPGRIHEQLLHGMLDVVVDDRARQLTAGLDVLDPAAVPLGDDPDDAESLDTVRVQVGVTPTGAFCLEVHFTDDVSRTLSPGEAAAYADQLLYAAVLAHYSEGVIRQLTTRFGASTEDAQQFVIELRETVPCVDQKAVKPLIVRPSVGRSTGKAFLHIRLAGTKQTWQWDLAQVVDHVQAVRAISLTVDLDSAYRRLLVGSYNLADHKARGTVDDLGDWIRAEF
jgi:hypothetical protein